MNPSNEPRNNGNGIRRRRLTIAFGVIAAGVLIGGGIYWLYSRSHEWTDDAAIEAHVLPISSKVAGQISRVAVADNQRVAQGDLLVEVDPKDFEVRLAEARAMLAAADAEARRSAADAARNKRLFERDQISRQLFDKVLADADVAKAKAEVARAQVVAAELDLSYTKVTAPEAGRVTKRTAELRQFVQVGQPLMAIVPDEVWVVANFKETQLARIRPGQPVRISVDAYPGREFDGHVDSIQRGSGARFSLFPPENATGNFVKVVQRIPVKIVFDQLPTDVFLSPGMSVTPVIHLK